MITNKMVARRVSAFGLALTGLMTMANTPAKAQNVPVADSCYATATGGGWALALSHNFDSSYYGIADNKFYFYAVRSFNITGRLLAERSIYNKANKSATFFASGVNGAMPVAVRIEVSSKGGMYNWGSAVMSIHNDLNRNGLIDAGEPALISSLAISLQGVVGCLK